MSRFLYRIFLDCGFFTAYLCSHRNPMEASMQTLSKNWAKSLVTDPSRAAASSKKARESAWHSLMHDRGKRCRYSWCFGTVSRPNFPGDAA